MEATNKELYALVLTDAPYVIAAYGVLWLALCAYVTLVLRRIMRIEKEMAVLEEAVERRSSKAASGE